MNLLRIEPVTLVLLVQRSTVELQKRNGLISKRQTCFLPDHIHSDHWWFFLFYLKIIIHQVRTWTPVPCILNMSYTTKQTCLMHKVFSSFGHVLSGLGHRVRWLVPPPNKTDACGSRPNWWDCVPVQPKAGKGCSSREHIFPRLYWSHTVGSGWK